MFLSVQLLHPHNVAAVEKTSSEITSRKRQRTRVEEHGPDVTLISGSDSISHEDQEFVTDTGMTPQPAVWAHGQPISDRLFMHPDTLLHVNIKFQDGIARTLLQA